MVWRNISNVIKNMVRILLNKLRILSWVFLVQNRKKLWWKKSYAKKVKNNIANVLSERGLEYTDCIPFIGVRPPPKKWGCPGYDTKLHLVVRLQFWKSVEYRIPLQQHYSLVHSEISVLVPVRIISQCQINLFENYLYSIGIF